MIDHQGVCSGAGASGGEPTRSASLKSPDSANDRLGRHMGRRGTIALLLLAAMPLLVAAGCGSSNKTESAANTTAAGTAAQASTTSERRAVLVDMGEFFFKPGKLTITAGKVEITAPNTGKVEHELVLLKTNA